METITLAGGCFWCTETIFLQLKGVLKVTPGYSGGNIDNPSYWDVASGKSGHAESVQVVFDPQQIALKNILDVFFKLHDPTQIDGQGVDIGTQYRSAVFYSSEEQKNVVKKAIAEAQKDYTKKIVTEISPYKNFFTADESHRNFYIKNKGGIYCTLVIDPKIKKLKSEFGNLTK